MSHRWPSPRRLAAAALIAGGSAAVLLAAGASSARPSRVADDHQRPFSSVGRLDVQYGDEVTSCTATLVGDSRTLITASHCVQPGATRLIFHLGNEGPGIEATIFARGDSPIPGSERDFDAAAPEAGVDKDPSPYWDDWLVLDLARPVSGQPLEHAAGSMTARLQRGEFSAIPFGVAGFPMSVDSGLSMVWVQGAGIPAFPDRSWRGTYSVAAQARTSEGMSGGAVLIPEGGDYVVAGVVSGGAGEETLIVVGGGFGAVDAKRAADCRAPAAGLTFSTPCSA